MLEVGAGLGSLTVALAEAGAHVLAVEFDRQVVAGAPGGASRSYPNVRIEEADAMRTDWTTAARRRPLVDGLQPALQRLGPAHRGPARDGPPIDRYVVMVQREVGERLVARPGDEAYGAVSVRVAYRADAPRASAGCRRTCSGRVRRSTRCSCGSTPGRPPSTSIRARCSRVVDEGFAERRKTMANALRRLGRDAGDADEIMRALDPDPSVRAERLGLDAFAAIARAMLERGGRPDREDDPARRAREDQRVPARALDARGRVPRHREPRRPDLARGPRRGQAGRGAPGRDRGRAGALGGRAQPRPRGSARAGGRLPRRRRGPGGDREA